MFSGYHCIKTEIFRSVLLRWNPTNFPNKIMFGFGCVILYLYPHSCLARPAKNCNFYAKNAHFYHAFGYCLKTSKRGENFLIIFRIKAPHFKRIIAYFAKNFATLIFVRVFRSFAMFPHNTNICNNQY